VPSSNNSRRGSGLDDLEQLRIAKTLARASLTECALIAGLPRWKVQAIFSGTTRATPHELRVLRHAIAKLARVLEKKRALLKEANLKAGV